MEDLSKWALQYGHLVFQNRGDFTSEIAGTVKIKHCNKNEHHLYVVQNDMIRFNLKIHSFSGYFCYSDCRGRKLRYK